MDVRHEPGNFELQAGYWAHVATTGRCVKYQIRISGPRFKSIDTRRGAQAVRPYHSGVYRYSRGSKGVRFTECFHRRQFSRRV